MTPHRITALHGFITATDAGQRFAITNDYVTQLCRKKKIDGMFVGRVWFVQEQSLAQYLSHMRQQQQARYLSLSRQWRPHPASS